MTVLLAASTLAALLSVPSPAQASNHGPGFYWAGDGTTFIGAYIPDGTSIDTYCVQGALGPPTNRHDTYDAGYGQYSGGDANANARVNYAVTVFGQTTNPVVAAAVAIYAHSQLDVAFYNSRPGGGLDWFASRANGSAGAVKAEFAAIAAAAAGITAGPVSASGTLTFTVNPTNNYKGTMTASGLPAGATGTVTLTNGVFNVNGTDSVTGVTEGSVFDVTGVPPNDGTTTWKISGSGLFTAPGGYAGNVNQFVTPGNRQLTVGPGQPAGAFLVTGEDPVDRSEIFLPVLSTQVSAKYVAAGDTFGDVLTFSTGAQADGTNNSWTQLANGDYRPVVANGTLYGPFSAPPAAATAPPAGAPVAGTATATTGTTGPTQPVVVTSGITATAPGYYVWVWTIDSADQAPGTQLYIPDPYTFSDQFGQVLETSITAPRVTTAATSTAVAGFAAHDTATVAGAVFDGAQLGFKAYKQNVDATGALIGAPVCDGTTLAASTALQPVNAAGDYDSPPVTFTAGGTYFWVETIYDSGGTAVASGQCGESGESTVVAQLTVTTQATSARTGTAVHDAATITGTVPAGAVLSFKAYQQGQDNSGAPIPANTCEATNMVFDSSSAPITLTAGVVDHVVVDGPATTFAAPGTVDWVETIQDAGGAVIAQGTCGTAAETSIITSPPPPPLARTGVDTPQAWTVWGAGLISTGLAISLLYTVWRRRRKLVPETN